MSTVFWLFLLVFIIIGGGLLFKFLEDRDKVEKLPYKTRPYFLNKSEMAFFLELRKTVPGEYYIFSKVRIIDFIEPIDKANYAKWRNKIWAKHVDFLICDQQSKPVMAIEVDGKSHRRPDRIERDKFVDKVFADTGLELQRIRVGSVFSTELEKITNKLN
ncbi:unnamed protein product [marine sediment metagenome]|uniref:DUF2726 domain-containing protein n=1 Tax=marine sediment metagenome TaxID=412755 RepID=X0U3S1_9ZZZZ